jgi:hypothetical protein
LQKALHNAAVGAPHADRPFLPRIIDGAKKGTVKALKVYRSDKSSQSFSRSGAQEAQSDD